jgi:hypothetical protein
MEPILKSNSKSKLNKVLVAATALLKGFGKGSDFPTTDEVRSKAWTSSW